MKAAAKKSGSSAFYMVFDMLPRAVLLIGNFLSFVLKIEIYGVSTYSEA